MVKLNKEHVNNLTRDIKVGEINSPVGNVVGLCLEIGLNNEQVMKTFDPQLFLHDFPENQEVRDISNVLEENMITTQELMVRPGVSGILEEANQQMQHGLGAHFGIKSMGLPAIFQSDIDMSDGETLRSTIQDARNEMLHHPDEIPTTTLRCIAKRLRPNSRSRQNWYRCDNRAVRGDQYCPLHLQVFLLK